MVTFLLTAGMVMVFSSSSMIAVNKYGTLTHFFLKQMMWSAFALSLMILFSNINYKTLKKYKLPVAGIIISFVLLAGLFVFGAKMNGARRWYNLGVGSFQPSELAKLAVIVYFAYYLSSAKKNIRDLKMGLLPLLGILGGLMALIAVQPDLSTALMLGVVGGTLLLISRAKISHLAMLSLPLIPAVILGINRQSFRLRRLHEWLAGWENPLHAGYQIKQSLIGLGRGGMFGQSLGQSKQKFLFLPDSHTDFIFSIIGEEWGFLGTTLILIAFMIIFYRGLVIARRVPDPFGKFLAVGIVLNIVAYALINAAVVSMLVPATGLPMPFISYGGSNLLFLGAAMGILLNISRQMTPAGANYVDYKQNRERYLKTVIAAD